MRTREAIGLAAVVAMALTGCATSGGAKPMGPMATAETTRESGKVTRTETVTVQAKVVAIDQRTRMVTLRDSDGKDVTFRAGEEVKNLPQVRKGDLVTAVYHRALAFRLHKPGEKDTGTESAAGVATARPGERPAAVGAQVVQVTATITKIDRAAQEVTLRGPKRTVTLAVEDPTVLDKVKKGDKVEVTYTEAIGISVDKP